MTLRAEKMAERRERILATARKMIAEGGFEALTTRSLARRARVTVPTIYNLVGARDAVLFAAVEDQTARFLAGLGDDEDLEAPARLVAVSEDCVEELLRDPRYYRALLPLLFGSDAAAGSRRAVGRTVVERYREALDAIASDGGLLEWIEPDELAARFASHVTAAALQWAVGDLSAADFRRTAVLDSCLLGLGATRGAAHAALEERARLHQRATRHGAGRSAGRRRRGAS